MIDMVRRHEIQVLRRAGHSLAETATLVGVSQSSVQRVEDEPLVTSFDPDAERTRREIGRRPRHTEDTLPPVVRAGLLHVQFETLHPYLDGNGRLGRCSSPSCSSTGRS